MTSKIESSIRICAFGANLANAKTREYLLAVLLASLDTFEKMFEYAISYERAIADARAG